MDKETKKALKLLVKIMRSDTRLNDEFNKELSHIENWIDDSKHLCDDCRE